MATSGILSSRCQERVQFIIQVQECSANAAHTRVNLRKLEYFIIIQLPPPVYVDVHACVYIMYATRFPSFWSIQNDNHFGFWHVFTRYAGWLQCVPKMTGPWSVGSKLDVIFTSISQYTRTIICGLLIWGKRTRGVLTTINSENFIRRSIPATGSSIKSTKITRWQLTLILPHHRQWLRLSARCNVLLFIITFPWPKRCAHDVIYGTRSLKKFKHFKTITTNWYVNFFLYFYFYLTSFGSPNTPANHALRSRNISLGRETNMKIIVSPKTRTA